MISGEEMIWTYESLYESAVGLLKLYQSGDIQHVTPRRGRKKKGKVRYKTDAENYLATMSECFSVVGDNVRCIDESYNPSVKDFVGDWFVGKNIKNLSLGGYRAFALIRLHAEGCGELTIQEVNKIVPYLVELLTCAASNVMMYCELRSVCKNSMLAGSVESAEKECLDVR